jgi:hypothetical protein
MQGEQEHKEAARIKREKKDAEYSARFKAKLEAEEAQRKEKRVKAAQHAADKGAPSWYCRLLMIDRGDPEYYEDRQSYDEYDFDEDISELGDEDSDDEYPECKCDGTTDCSCEDRSITNEEKLRKEPYTGSDAEYFYELKGYRSQRKHELREERYWRQKKKDEQLEVERKKDKEVQEAYARLQRSAEEANSPPTKLDLLKTGKFTLHSSEFTELWWDENFATRYISFYNVDQMENLGVPTGPGGVMNPVTPKKGKKKGKLNKEGNIQGHIYFNASSGCDFVDFIPPKYFGLEEQTLKCHE